MRTGQIHRVALMASFVTASAFGQAQPVDSSRPQSTRPATAPGDTAAATGESKQAKPSDEPAAIEPPGTPDPAPPSSARPAPELSASTSEHVVATKPEVMQPEGATDTLRGHFQLGVGGGLTIPFGFLTTNVQSFETMGLGSTLHIDLGYGVSRTVLLGLWGQAAWLSGGANCNGTPVGEPSCQTSTIAAGASVTYHLVQGTRFDPWLSAGLGYRTTQLKVSNTFDYSGPALLRLAIGGDWYAFRHLGLGPWLELNGTVNSSHPSVSPLDSRRNAENGRFSILAVLGLRAVFDFPGK